MINKYKFLYLKSFPFDSEIYFDKIIAPLDPKQTFYAIENDDVVSGCYLRNFDFFASGKVHEISVLGGVCTAVEKRGKGLTGIAISKALNFMFDKGQPFCFLHPVSYKYYHRFGFIGIERADEVKLCGTEDCKVTELSKINASEIVDFIAKTNQNRNFYVLCHTYYIERCFDETQACGGNVYKLSSQDMTAYVFITGNSIDYAFTDNAEKLKQIGFLNGLNFTDYNGTNPDYTQGRITNVIETISLINPIKPFDFTVKIIDSIISGNNLCFRVVSDGKNIKTQMVNNAKYEISVDELFSKIIFGTQYNAPINPTIRNKY